MPVSVSVLCLLSPVSCLLSPVSSPRLQSRTRYVNFSLHTTAPSLQMTAHILHMTAHQLRVCILTVLCLGRCVTATATEFQGVPLPENTSIALAVFAEGVQIYESKLNSMGTLEWALKAPEAELKNAAGEVIGKHFGGPSWSLNDGSQVVGSLPPLKAVNAPDGKNIPWLLVAAKSRSEAGWLSKIDFVLRIATSGGVAPAEAPKNQADTVRVNYRATYLFLRKQSGP